MSQQPYVIRGGIEGRERLRILSRVLHPTTSQLLKKAGVSTGMTCLDLGCGGGDVSFYLANLVGPEGRVTGIDKDETKIKIARSEVIDKGLSQVEFIADDIYDTETGSLFDVIYARFLLTHMQDPRAMLDLMYKRLQPGGIVILEDIDFRGHFSYPENRAFNRYVELYCAVSLKAKGDPYIGQRFPSLLKEAGFENVELNIVQPAGTVGEVKFIAAITMENIADAVIRSDLASRKEIDEVVAELYKIAEDDHTLISLPRIVQVKSKIGNLKSAI